MTMTKPREKTVKVAELKARLSACLQEVRQGRPLTVYDRETPIARLVPYTSFTEALTVRQPIRALHDIPMPPPLSRPVDSLAALVEER